MATDCALCATVSVTLYGNSLGCQAAPSRPEPCGDVLHLGSQELGFPASVVLKSSLAGVPRVPIVAQMPNDHEPCPLCQTDVRIHRDALRQLTRYQCPCCGEYEACDQDFELGWVEEPYYLLTSFLRLRYERTGRPYLFADRDGDRLPQDLAHLPVPEKLNLALLGVAERTPRFGRPSSCNLATDWPLAQAADAVEFGEMLAYWRQEGALEGDPKDPVAVQAQGGFVLTGKGWQIVEDIKPSRSGRGKQAFVAMSFSEEMDSAYDNGIEPALRECGWSPVRVDREQFEQKICDHIVSEIRRSDLVVVECTGSSPNVYFEAGFAMGLGIPVVWCVRQEELENKKVAFDTRQYPHLSWTEEASLRSMLVDRVRALYATR